MDKYYKIHLSSKVKAPWIVFINGLFADYSSWDQAVDLLGDDYHILRYNGPGQGENKTLDEINPLSKQVAYLFNLIESLKIQNAYFIGISNGARVALEFSRLYPHLVKSAIVADSYAKLDRGLRAKLESWLYSSKLGGNELRFKVSTPWIFGESFLKEKPEFLDWFYEKIKDKDQNNSELLIRSALEDYAIDLAEIKVPVHYLVGHEDRLTPVDIHLEMMAQTPISSVDIIKGGHASLLEYPENFTKFVIPKLVEGNSCIG